VKESVMKTASRCLLHAGCGLPPCGPAAGPVKPRRRGPRLLLHLQNGARAAHPPRILLEVA
jgi:hypothetical protein